MVAGSGPHGEHITADAAKEYALQAERMIDRISMPPRVGFWRTVLQPASTAESEATAALAVSTLAVATEIAALRETLTEYLPGRLA